MFGSIHLLLAAGIGRTKQTEEKNIFWKLINIFFVRDIAFFEPL